MTTKHSKKRDAILRAVKGTVLHPSAYMVYDSLKRDIPDLSLATVYRNLSLFKGEGLVQSVATVNGEERYDGNTAPHLHFVCSGCGKVLDVKGEANLSECERKLESSLHVRVTGRTVLFSGICENCENRV